MSRLLSQDRTGFLVSCCSIALREKPVFEAVETIAAAGFSAVELLHSHFRDLNDEGLSALAARCKELQIEITVLSPYFTFTRGAEGVRGSLRTAEKVVRAAGILGVKKIRAFMDIGSDGLPSARAEEIHWQAACGGLRALCALDPSIAFVIETHENTLADTLPSIRRLLAGVPAPNLRLNFQANRDFLKRGYLESLRELLPLTTHFHWQQVDAAGHETYLEEPGVIPFAEVISQLRSANYAGTASVEYCWPDVPPDRLATAARFLASLFEIVRPGQGRN